MRQNKQNILVTRPLTARQKEYARILGLEPIIQPSLNFTFPEYWDEVLSVINDNTKADWIFTSANGVKALEQMMKAGFQVRPETQLFAVGRKTKEALQDLGLDAKIPATQDAKHLAEFIIEEGKSNSVIYFHGNLSRHELTEKLEDEGIGVIRLEVYETHISPVYLPDKPVSGILFYSPSAVEGFKKGEGFNDNLPPLFAIGPTTAKALEQETNQPVTFARIPDTEELLRTAANAIFKEAESV